MKYPFYKSMLFIASLITMVSCSRDVRKGNLVFSSTTVESVVYQSQNTTLSLEKQNLLFSILDAQTWGRPDTTVSSKDFPNDIQIHCTRTVSHGDDLYEQGEHPFTYFGNLVTGEFFLDDDRYSSFHALTLTTVSLEEKNQIQNLFAPDDTSESSYPSSTTNDSVSHPKNAYKLQIQDNTGLLQKTEPDDTDRYYTRNTEICFYFTPIYDADIVAYENDNYTWLSSRNVTIDGQTYSKCTYFMPDEDVTLRFEIETQESVPLNTLYPWINDLKAEDIDQMISHSLLGSICPNYSSTENYTIANEEETESTINWLKTTTVLSDPHQMDISGGSGTSLTIRLKNKTEYKIYEMNGQLNVGKDCYCDFYLPWFKTYYAESFLYHCDFALCKNGTVVKEDVPEMRSIIFKKLDETPTPDAIFYGYTFTSSGETITILSRDIFSLNSDNELTYYQIIEGPTFDTFILNPDDE